MRRARRKDRARGDDAARLLPLVNVAFLLLLALLIAGRIPPPQPFVAEPPASAQEGAPAGPALVTMAADGRLALDGAEMDRAALLAALGPRLEADVARAATLRADASADGAALAALVADLRAVGARSVRLATRAMAP